MLPALSRVSTAISSTQRFIFAAAAVTANQHATTTYFMPKTINNNNSVTTIRFSSGSADEVSPDRAYNESRLVTPIKLESYDIFEQRLRNFFNRTDIDGWDVRRGLTELNFNDVIPEPETIICAMRAIRRCNDHSLAVRFLENIKDQASDHKEIYPWLIEQVRPELEALGISTPEELGYDKPELACPDPDDDGFAYKRAGPTNAEKWEDVVKRGGHLDAHGHAAAHY